MALITIIISLLLEKFWSGLGRLRRFDWYRRYLQALYRRLGDRPWMQGPLFVIVALALLLVPFWILVYFIYEWSLLAAFAAGLLTLIFTLGPANAHELVQQYVNDSEGEDAERLLHQAFGDILPGDRQSLYVMVLERSLIEVNERLLAILFWFLLFGPAGALLARLAVTGPGIMAADEEGENRGLDAMTLQTMRQLKFILLWLPARMTALGFAITGSFVHTFEMWRKHVNWSRHWPDSNEAILIAAGIGAMHVDADEQGEISTPLTTSHLQETLDLCMRAVLLWLLIYSVLILAGLIGY